jgi:hypothetical protein
MPFFGCYAPAVSGETCRPTFPTGRLYTTTAPAARFDRWKKAAYFEHINATLNQLDRQQADREPLPSAASIDTQSIKLAPMIGEWRGLDAHKKVNGRKRTFVVDTQGRLWVADVDAANRADGSLGKALIVAILWRMGERLEKMFGDRAASAVRLQRRICQRA